MSTADVIRMANQIAANFATLPEAEAAAAVATHIRMFWEPRMRAQLLDHVDAGGTGLLPAVMAAADRLREQAAP